MSSTFTYQFFSKGSPNVTCSHLRAGPAHVSLLGELSRIIFKVCQTAVTAWVFCNLLQNLIALTGIFLLLSPWNFPGSNLQLFLVAHALVRRIQFCPSWKCPSTWGNVNVVCKCDPHQPFLLFSLASSAVALLRSDGRNTSEVYEMKHSVRCLTRLWKGFEKHWKHRWNSQLPLQKSSIVVVQLQTTLNMLIYFFFFLMSN